MRILFVFLAISAFFTAVAIPIPTRPSASRDSKYARSRHYVPPTMLWRQHSDVMLQHEQQSITDAVVADHRKLPSRVAKDVRQARVYHSWQNEGGQDFVTVQYADGPYMIEGRRRVYKLPNSAVLQIPPDSPGGPGEVCNICGERVTTMASYCHDETHKACETCTIAMYENPNFRKLCAVCRQPLGDTMKKIDCASNPPEEPPPPALDLGSRRPGPSSPRLQEPSSPRPGLEPSSTNRRHPSGNAGRACGGQCSIL